MKITSKSRGSNGRAVLEYMGEDRKHNMKPVNEELDPEKNVCDAIMRVENRSVRKEALTLNQIKTLHSKAKKFKSKFKDFWPTAIALAYHTGLRLGDVCTLSWDEINLKDRMIRLIPYKTYKKGIPVVHRMHDDYFDFFLQRRKLSTSNFVWPDAAAALKKRNGAVDSEFNELCRLSGLVTDRPPGKNERRGRKVKMIGFHSLRHAFVTISAESGIPMRDRAWHRKIRKFKRRNKQKYKI